MAPAVPSSTARRGGWAKTIMRMDVTRQGAPITGEALGKMIITDVLERWPETAEVFYEHTMACVGCAVAPFYTINDAAIVYNLSPEALIEEFLAIIGSDLIV